MNERQLKYLEVLRTTGNPSRARQAAGVVRKTVSLWERDVQFSEAAEEVQGAALDEIVEASRNAALAGDSAQMTNWLKIARPELRPAGTQVAVGVRVGGERPQSASMSDEELIARARAILDDLDMREAAQVEYEARQRRLLGAGDAIDVEVPPAAVVGPEPSAGHEIDPEDLV